MDPVGFRKCCLSMRIEPVDCYWEYLVPERIWTSIWESPIISLLIIKNTMTVMINKDITSARAFSHQWTDLTSALWHTRFYWSHINGADLTSSQWHTAGNQVRFSERCNTNIYDAQFFFQASVVTTLKATQATVWVWCHRRHGHWTQTRSQWGLNEVQTRSREWLGHGMAYHLRHVYS